MDHARFDDLTRALAAGASRRGVLKGLLGAALGGALGLVGLEDAAAACRLIGQRCSATAACCAGAKCANGRCACKTGQGFRACNGDGTRCVNTLTSEQHCGACGNACPTGATCCGGSCTTVGESCTTGNLGICATGTRQCVENQAVCVGIAPGSQPEVCDGQDNDCNGEIDDGPICPPVANGRADCQFGRCVVSCLLDRADCDGVYENGCETDLTSSVDNCGTCGRVCPPVTNGERTCRNGSCGVDCSPGFHTCDNKACVSDATMCGTS